MSLKEVEVTEERRKGVTKLRREGGKEEAQDCREMSGSIELIVAGH